MHASQAAINDAVAAEGLPGLRTRDRAVSTGEAAAALLGSDERLEYTLVGDTVNLCPAPPAVRRRGRDGALRGDAQLALRRPRRVPLGAQLVKGRDTPVVSFKLAGRVAGRRVRTERVDAPKERSS